MVSETWVVRAALVVALLGTAWGTGVMVTSPDSIAVSLAPTGTSVREIVPATTGGSIARVLVSNASGAAPVMVADVRIAPAAAGTGRAVTFGGKGSTTIPAGGTVTSDPVEFPVAARADVAVSVYLPHATAPAPIVTGLDVRDSA